MTHIVRKGGNKKKGTKEREKRRAVRKERRNYFWVVSVFGL